MTCIVGYVEEGKVYIGGDSAGVAGYHVVQRADEKVFKKGEMIFGFTTSFRMGQIIRYCFEPPDHDPRVETDKYLCNDFVSELIKCYKKNGYNRKDKDGQTRGGTFLMGYKGNLYTISGDFQVGKPLDDFDSCGCGMEYALGSLNILNKTNMDPTEKVKWALSAAEKFSGGVLRPFNIVSV